MALKVDVLQDRKIYRFQAFPCIFQPGNFAVWGSEGVSLLQAHEKFSVGRINMNNYETRMNASKLDNENESLDFFFFFFFFFK